MFNFYVYAFGNIDSPYYIGKGCGKRLKAQCRRFGESGYELARFKYEDDALDFERKLISEYKPAENKTVGGDGGRTGSKIRLSPFQRELYSCDSRRDLVRLVARKLLTYDLSKHLEQSKVDVIRGFAHG